MTYLSQFIAPIQHCVGSAPPDIAVKRDFEGNADAALDLQLIEVLNAGTRSLNLMLC